MEMLRRLPLSMTTVFVSMVLGHIALVYVGIFYPERLEGMIEVAGSIKKVIVGTGLPSKYNVWVRLLLEEKSLLFMFFSILARIALTIFGAMLAVLWGWIRGPRH